MNIYFFRLIFSMKTMNRTHKKIINDRFSIFILFIILIIGLTQFFITKTNKFFKDNHPTSPPTFAVLHVDPLNELYERNTAPFNDPAASPKYKHNRTHSHSDLMPILPKTEPTSLKALLQDYDYGSTAFHEEKAFRRVLKWKDDFEAIADIYPHVDWNTLSAITKAETQGRTGKQISPSKAIGMFQIKYQGAWAFFWDVMFSEKIKDGDVIEKDYYNRNLRLRYKNQVARIKMYLEQNRLLVYPQDTLKAMKTFKTARYKTWQNLKLYLDRRYVPGEYQVSVDIAAMYIDHLRDTFKKLSGTLNEIKRHISENPFTDLDHIKWSGVKKFWWDRINHQIQEERKTHPYMNEKEMALAYLNYFIERLEDPRIYLAAYNFGIGKVLTCIEEVNDFPPAIKTYVKDVTTYNRIFLTMEKYGL